VINDDLDRAVAEVEALVGQSVSQSVDQSASQ